MLGLSEESEANAEGSVGSLSQVREETNAKTITSKITAAAFLLRHHIMRLLNP
jgi:hypothetical protein